MVLKPVKMKMQQEEQCKEDDFEGNMAKFEAEPQNPKRIALCDPMQLDIVPGQEGRE